MTNLRYFKEEWQNILVEKIIEPLLYLSSDERKEFAKACEYARANAIIGETYNLDAAELFNNIKKIAWLSIKFKR